MNDLERYNPTIVTNGTDRVATMIPDKKGKWFFRPIVKMRISALETRVKALEVSRDTWMGKYTALRNAVDGET